MPEGKVDPRIKAWERYLTEVLQDYYGKEGISKRAMSRWALIGVGRLEMIGLVSVFIMMFLSLVVIDMDIGNIRFCVSGLLILTFFLILPILLWRMTVGSSAKHPGWFRAYEVPLSDTIESIGHTMSETGIEFKIYKIILRDLQFDARGAVFTTKGTNIDVTVWKDRYMSDRTLVHVSRISSGQRSHLRNIMNLIDRAVLNI